MDRRTEEIWRSGQIDETREKVFAITMVIVTVAVCAACIIWG